jgi:hypothetical protein
MAEINLDAHYTNNPKVQRSEKVVSNMPAQLPKRFSFNEKEADRKIKSYNQDLFVKSKQEEQEPFRNFMKYFCIGVGSVLLFKLGRKIFKKS